MLKIAADEVGAAGHVVADLVDPVEVEALVAALPEPVDVLVNSAGGNTDFDLPAPDDDLGALRDAWTSNWNSNVITAVLTTTALLPRMGSGGRIVNLGSIAAAQGAGSYGAAKAALESWTVTLSGHVGRRGITANVVAPGLTEPTEFFRGRLSAERRQRLIEATDTGRTGTTADIAATVGFLASAAAGHISGQVVHVNGGAFHGR